MIVGMIPVGTSAEVSLTVEHRDTAVALRSGDVEVLGTPRVVALCEEAAVRAAADHLASESTSVGTNVTIDHLAATGVGRTVVATATVTAVERRTIEFDIEVRDGDTLAARGTHTRVVVDRDRFKS